MKKKKVIALIATCSLIAAMGIGGTLVYLTDQTKATNSFTFGDIKVDTIETAWDTTDEDGDGVPDAAEDQIPNQQTPKSVQAKNVGINDAIVFAKITVPLETVTRVFNDGTVELRADGKHDTKLQEIFYFEREGDSVNVQNNNFDENWINIPEEELGYDEAGSSEEYLDLSPENTRGYTGKYRTYVFGYNKRLGKDEITTTLFDKVQLKNILQNEVATAGTVRDIVVETYSIQADNIVNDNGTIDTSGELSHDTLKEIYDIYVKQNPDALKVGDTSSNVSNKTDTESAADTSTEADTETNDTEAGADDKTDAN